MPANIPFMHPSLLQDQNLPMPDREQTAKSLSFFNFYRDDAQSDALKAYQMLYGLDRLPCQYWQGYYDISVFRVHVQVFQPISTLENKGTVLLVHGYLEHSAIYQPIIAELLAQGFSVLSFDLPGHGLSDGTVAGIDDFNDYQDILLGLYTRLHDAKQLPKPWFGIGQSTGGAILMHHLLEFAEKRLEPIIDRALLLSPLVRPARSAWWHTNFGLGLVSKVVSEVPRSFRRNNHNPEFLRFVRLQDPLQPRTMHMNWIVAMTKWMQEMDKRPACRIPIWLAQGALDQTVDWKYNCDFVRRKFRLQTFLLLEEGSHQLINEREDIRAALTGLIPAFLHAKYKPQYY